MKYISADKLLSEIERRIQRCEDCERDGYPDTTSSEATLKSLRSFITSLQQEQPMPDSTKLIELWHEDKEMLKEKDFRDDPWRLAYNAFLCGFGRGISVKKQEQPEPTCKSCGFYENNCPFIRNTFKPYPNRVCKDYTYSVMKEQEQPDVDLKKEIEEYCGNRKECPVPDFMEAVAYHFYELGLNARKEK